MNPVQIDADFSKLEALIKDLHSEHFVDIGILGAANYKDGATIAGVGAVHEFGSINGNIPERSFIRMPLEKSQGEIDKKIRDSHWLDMLIREKTGQIFRLIGIECVAAIQSSFDTRGFGTWQPITEQTVQRKGGSDAILIDEGTLRKHITFEVGGGK
jgi:hypothetical protein